MSGPILNRKLHLDEAQMTPDGAGGFDRTWVELGVLWAEIKPGTGRERGAEHLTVSTIPLRVTVRAAPHGAPSRPKPEQRFRAGNRLFRILAVTESDHTAQFLTCFCQEEVSA